jgi:hypothetical protein
MISVLFIKDSCEHRECLFASLLTSVLPALFVSLTMTSAAPLLKCVNFGRIGPLFIPVSKALLPAYFNALLFTICVPFLVTFRKVLLHCNAHRFLTTLFPGFDVVKVGLQSSNTITGTIESSIRLL